MRRAAKNRETDEVKGREKGRNGKWEICRNGKRGICHTLKFKLIGFLVILVIPFMIILYWNNYYSIQLAQHQMDEYTLRLLDNYVEQLNTSMSNVSEYLLRMCLGDAQNLNVYDKNDRYFYRMELHEELENVIGFYDIAQGFFVYQATYDEFAQYTAPTLNYQDASVIGTYVQGHLSDILAQDAQTWNLIQIQGKEYFFYTLKTGETYIGAWISIQEVMEQIHDLQMGTLLAVNFEGDEGIAASRYFGEAANMAEASEMGSSDITDRQAGLDEAATYEVRVHLDAVDMDIVTVLETVPFYQLLSLVQKVIIVFSIIVVILLLCSIFIYRRYIFRPMDHIEYAIHQVEQGNWDYRIQSDGHSTEFDSIDQNFNAMAGEIHNLKIDVYEKEIERQQVELDYLHYQIKPHFILNVINTINSMAQIKETALIQKMTQYLSGYIRYTFRRDHSMATIREELETVKNYLNMQLLRFSDSLECEIDIESRVMDMRIPAMTIMTFVENIIKHAFDMYDCIKITVKAFLDDEGKLHIVIKDSGNGFSPEAIRHIMTCEQIGEGGKQVGIVNIKRRLRLVYGQEAQILASNEDGARIEIILPEKKMDTGKKKENLQDGEKH